MFCDVKHHEVNKSELSDENVPQLQLQEKINNIFIYDHHRINR